MRKKSIKNIKKASTFSKKKLETELLRAFIRLSNEKRSKSDIKRSRNFEKRQRESDRKNVRNTKKKTSKTKKYKIFRSVDRVRFINNSSLTQTKILINLKKQDQLDLFDLENQDSQFVYSVIYPYFDALLKYLRKKSKYFRVAITFFDLEEYDQKSTALANFDIIPQAVEKQVLYLIDRLIMKAQEYRKYHTIFKLMSIELNRYDEVK